MYSVTKEFWFSAAHRLYGYQGKCANIHGHNYHTLVTLSGELIPLGEKAGMVIDFGDIKRIVSPIIDKFDHVCILCADDEQMIDALQGLTSLLLVPYNPTAENMARDIAERVQKEFTHFSVKVVIYETQTSCAEYTTNDKI